ncbi:outer membrane beta-barrel protein [Gemmatimonas sp.]|uniref:outer membrane beta-barrel protein n=1 Tax=Gemmatimonas sp. TaxID=1962908 RepID=UPI0039830010
MSNSVRTASLSRLSPAAHAHRLAVLVLSSLLATALVANIAKAQTGVGATLTPYAGYLITGNWYDGPIGTNLSTTNAPLVGGQASIPLTKGIALVGNLAYAAGDLRIGLPLLGGVNVGTVKTWLYDAGLELGGLPGKKTGIAPYVQVGIGGLTNDIKNSLFDVRASNIAYTGGVGLDIGLAESFALRVQAKDWVSRFNSEDAVGFRAEGNLTHNWALTAGVKLTF